MGIGEGVEKGIGMGGGGKCGVTIPATLSVSLVRC